MRTFEISKEMTFHAALFSKLHRDVSHQNMGGNISRRRMSWDPGHRSTQKRDKRNRWRKEIKLRKEILNY